MSELQEDRTYLKAMVNQTTARISVFLLQGPSTQYRALSQT